MSFDPYDFEDILKSKDDKDKWETCDRFPQVFQCDTYFHSLACHPGYPDLSPMQVSAPFSWQLHPQSRAPPSSTSPHGADTIDALPIYCQHSAFLYMPMASYFKHLGFSA